MAQAVRFAIVGGSRSGSGHLVWTLNRDADIVCHSEVFHGTQAPLRLATRAAADAGTEDIAGLREQLTGLRARDPFAYLERIYSIPGDTPIVGFKIFRGHNAAVLDRIVHDPAIRKLLLFRANALARYASVEAARLTGDHHKAYKPKVPFDRDQFLSVTSGYTDFIEETLNTLVTQDQPYRFVRYDELNNAALMQSVVAFLGARPLDFNDGAVRSEVRASPDILSRFSNPEDAEAYLRDHGLMHWAHEGDVRFGLAAPPASPLPVSPGKPV